MEGLERPGIERFGHGRPRPQPARVMTSVDTNILLFSYCENSAHHAKSKAFLISLADREDVALSEFVLSELYLLLRNPAVLEEPLNSNEAVEVIQRYRLHPRWQIVGFPPRSRDLHAEIWKQAAGPHFARRRIYDVRTALCLQAFGVKEFATANIKDFEGLGFNKVWDPSI
jgi:predicted nucleic acid-binding protein